MAEVGILAEKGIELINGEIIEMSPIGSHHAAFVEKTKDFLVIALQRQAIVRVQNPIITDTFSEPEPDIAVARYRKDYYRHAHPQAKDILLLIEVADSSIAYDREVKLPLYAAAGIPEVWIIDVKGKKVEIHRIPSGKKYMDQQLKSGTDLIVANEIEFTIRADELLELEEV